SPHPGRALGAVQPRPGPRLQSQSRGSHRGVDVCRAPRWRRAEGLLGGGRNDLGHRRVVGLVPVTADVEPGAVGRARVHVEAPGSRTGLMVFPLAMSASAWLMSPIG